MGCEICGIGGDAIEPHICDRCWRQGVEDGLWSDHDWECPPKTPGQVGKVLRCVRCGHSNRTMLGWDIPCNIEPGIRARVVASAIGVKEDNR